MIRKKSQASAVSSLTLNEMLQKLPFFAACLDEKGSVVFFNSEAERLTGYRGADVLKKDFVSLFVRDEKKEPFRRYFFSLSEQKGAKEPFICYIIAKGREERYMEFTGVKEGRLLWIIGKDLSEVFLKISGMLSKVLHEINNSATFIIGNTPFLKEAWDDIRKVTDKHQDSHPGFELARLPYEFFRAEYPQVIHDIETGCRRMKSIVEMFREMQRTINEQKD